MDYRKNEDVTRINKYTWGDDLFIYEAPGRKKAVEGLIIQSIDRQAIPSISRSTTKVPGLNGVRMMGKPSLGSSEINIACTKFTNSRKEALAYRNTLLNLFYEGSQGGEIEIIIPDTGKPEYVWLIDIETVDVTKDGIISFNIKLENPTGFSHSTFVRTGNTGESFKITTVEPVSPIISFYKVQDINKEIKIYTKTNGVYKLAIVIPALNTISYREGSNIEESKLKSITVDSQEQSIIYGDVGYNYYDVTAEVLKKPAHLLDFKALKSKDEICLKTENVASAMDIKFTQYTL